MSPTPSMLRLGTFGGVTVTRDGLPLPGVVTGSQRAAALLALLAGSGTRGVARETLAALFWPESGEAAARHSLDQVLLGLRRTLGRDAIVGGAALHANPECVTCDVAEFEEAVHGGQLERAVAVYRGPFADGVTLRVAPDVERRLDVLRVGYARTYASALERLARGAHARDDHAGAARWWQRLADAEPLSALAARELVATCVAAGEPARALQQALVHESLARQEGVAPDAAIVAWIGRLRTATPVSSAAVATGALAQGAAPRRATFDAAESLVAGDVADQERRRVASLAGVVGQRYRIGALVEEGTMVVTYAAVAVASPGAGGTAGTAGGDVELHLVQPRVATMATAERFVAAMRRAAALSDARVLPTLDAGAARDVLWFATARRLPVTLRERMRGGALPIADALAIGRDLAAALGHAHAHGVHHGDLRPKHVGVGAAGGGAAGGTAAVLRGLGVIEGVTHAADGDDRGRSTIVALGAPAYLSPEQLAGEVHVDARSDVYALGCILYEMLAGEPPFGRRSHGTQLRRKLTEPAPSLRAQRDRVPDALDALVHHCLARVPADRPSSAAEVAQALATMRPT